MAIAANPVRGTGHRDQECGNYERCLDMAAKKNWPAFNCEECEIAYTGFEPEAEEESFLESETEDDEEVEEAEGDGESEGDEGEGDGSAEDEDGEDGEAVEQSAESSKNATKPEVRLCEQCGEKPTITPSHRLCAHCMSVKGNKAKAEAAKAGDASKLAQKAARTAQGGPKGFTAKDIPADLNPCQGRGFMDLTCPWFAVCRGRFDVATDPFFRCERCRIFQDRIRMYFGVSANRAETAPTAAVAASSGSPGKVDTSPSASAVTVDFSEHGGILEATRRRAVEEIRSLPHQIIFMVKTTLGQ